jgi:DNA-binding transcriptional MerR regulator
VTTEQYHNRKLNISHELVAKPFFKIGEVAKLVGVKPHVIRYWETEFPSLMPKKNPSGQRIYVKADIEAIVEIKNLLYNERYTISGAKLMLARQKEGVSETPLDLELARVQALASLKEQVVEILMLLAQKPSL